jgi:hypothetical protein
VYGFHLPPAKIVKKWISGGGRGPVYGHAAGAPGFRSGLIGSNFSSRSALTQVALALPSYVIRRVPLNSGPGVHFCGPLCPTPSNGCGGITIFTEGKTPHFPVHCV